MVEASVDDTGGNFGSGVWHIFKAKADGTSLTDFSGSAGHPAYAFYLPSFSPDGNFLVMGAIFEDKKQLENSFVDILFEGSKMVMVRFGLSMMNI